MPFFDYECECGWAGSRLVHVEDRDDQWCAWCDARLKREEIAVTGPPATRGAYQLQGIFQGGRKVPGHFGKEAKRKR